MAPIRAAQYLRMSTEHQNYSLTAQTAHIAAFAGEHGFEIVQTFTDSGISGLTYRRRPGLKGLMAAALGGKPDFKAILVFDVSRWGRFQDPDQAGHYEFMCREAGLRVIYTAEPFATDTGPASSFLKYVKRMMAAEFSRDLGAKITFCSQGLRGLGFWVGGAPGYGFRRMAVSLSREPGMVMQHGERKALRGHRTLLVHGPPEEVAVVRRIYREFLVEGRKILSIARGLNDDGICAEFGRPWTSLQVWQVLRNEKYAGTLVWNRSECRLGERRVLPRRAWIRVEGAIPAIVDQRTFQAVQAQFMNPKERGASDETLVDELRQVLADTGKLSIAIINGHPAAHCAEVYKRRFKGMLNAYRLAGFEPTRRQLSAHERATSYMPWQLQKYHSNLTREEGWARLERHLAEHGRVTCSTIENDPSLPCVEWYRRRFGPMKDVYEKLGYRPPESQTRYMGTFSERRERRSESLAHL